MKRTATIIVAAVLVVTACQSASEQLAEQVAGVNDVDIDTDTGQIRIETDEGSLSIGGGELPDGFPIPVPDGGDVMSVFTSGDQAAATVSYARDRYDELVRFYDEWTEGQSGDWNTGSSSFAQGGQTMRSSSWFGSDTGIDISIAVTDCFGLSGDSDEFDAVCVNLVTS